jgi:outer membrane protein
MKKILFVIIGVGLLSLPLTSFSQALLKIGHVNFEEIMSALPETDTAKAILDKESKEFRTAFEELTVAYNQLYEEYQKGLSSYTPITKKTKEDELLDKQKRMSEFEQNATATLQNRNAELVKPIIDKINKAIEKVATDNGFTYILDTSKGAVVFTSKDSQNITTMVIKIVKP